MNSKKNLNYKNKVFIIYFKDFFLINLIKFMLTNFQPKKGTIKLKLLKKIKIKKKEP